ncbi:MAG: site-specific DNA-methyltransferase [Armatimonadetes bacterium CG07_land_8_20_14_0_80_40_9]|nr:MAG: site-specific DNA-methyltransferase [Armatimonadetes bacterium CG07_land_8_20_14_0_80_40_9]
MRNKTDILNLFDSELLTKEEAEEKGRTTERVERLDLHGELQKKILPLCRLKYGDIWEDKVFGHKVGVLDAIKQEDVKEILGDEKAKLIVNDPPYNITVGNANTNALFKINIEKYLKFSKEWVRNAILVMDKNAHFYIWLGADYRDNLQPFPDFIILLREFKGLKPKNIITMRNQRGYGTQKNWMWVRQELLYYVKGNPDFNVDAEYTDIPKILRGYYKEVNGRITENLERSRSRYIRAGNVWVDIQQVFYRMEENVPGCYAQKPLKAIERIILSGSRETNLIVDFFAHSGTTLIAGEKIKRKVYTFDIDPIFAEITIRRLEHFRRTGKTGWQWQNPFPEIEKGKEKQKWT